MHKCTLDEENHHHTSPTQQDSRHSLNKSTRQLSIRDHTKVNWVLLVNLGLLPVTIFWLTGNAAEVSGLSAAIIYASYFVNVWSSGAKTFTDSRHGNLYFHRVIRFRFLSEFYFRSHFYIRDSGGTTASPCVWPEDHGRGRFCTTYLARSCHYGCRVSFPGRPHRSWLAWQVAATYDTWRCGFLGFLPESHYLLDSESTQRATEITTLPQVKYEKILRPKRRLWKLAKNGNCAFP